MRFGTDPKNRLVDEMTILLPNSEAHELLMNGIEREIMRQGKKALWTKLLTVAELTPFQLPEVLFRRVHKQFETKFVSIVSCAGALDRYLGPKWDLLSVKIMWAGAPPRPHSS